MEPPPLVGNGSSLSATPQSNTSIPKKGLFNRISSFVRFSRRSARVWNVIQESLITPLREFSRINDKLNSFDTPFSCIETPNKTSAIAIVCLLCVMIIN